ncbi:MAG: thiol:disulfide interchange protein DsbG [Luteibacter sp.]|uniref:thiol:disulfide interchange protein DsbG n=1 Tax=Luteibacter sp. TaxID=1886636 RepID=UPI002809380B|nr:thiol:disulfide interchange protein DsbG [Luteibacter sp.]MDQ7995253.1 thiol:disulfide interchange protein DsbG [Luteibacter sp.]
MLRSTIALALALILPLHAPPALAATNEAPLPPVVQALQAQGLTEVHEFQTGATLRAFAGLIADEPLAVYVTPDGQAFVGTRVGQDGKPLDDDGVKTLTVKATSAKTLAQLKQSTWVQDGKTTAPRVIYNFTDPNCPYCHRFWEAARPWVDAGRVQIRHLLVGVIRDDSPNKAAAILGAPDPSAAFLANETKFGAGGIGPVKTVPNATQSILDHNQMLMLSLGFQGTPGIVVVHSDGTLTKFSGLPQGQHLERLFGPKP